MIYKSDTCLIREFWDTTRMTWTFTQIVCVLIEMLFKFGDLNLDHLTNELEN